MIKIIEERFIAGILTSGKSRKINGIYKVNDLIAVDKLVVDSVIWTKTPIEPDDQYICSDLGPTGVVYVLAFTSIKKINILGEIEVFCNFPATPQGNPPIYYKSFIVGDDGFYILQQEYSPVYGYFIVKYSFNLEVMWRCECAGGYSGSMMFKGRDSIYFFNDSTYYLSKISKLDGSIQWSRVFGYGINGVVEDLNDNVYVSWNTYVYDNHYSGYKLNSVNGDIVWIFSAEIYSLGVTFFDNYLLFFFANKTIKVSLEGEVLATNIVTVAGPWSVYGDKSDGSAYQLANEIGYLFNKYDKDGKLLYKFPSSALTITPYTVLTVNIGADAIYFCAGSYIAKVSKRLHYKIVG